MKLLRVWGFGFRKSGMKLLRVWGFGFRKSGMKLSGCCTVSDATVHHTVTPT